MRINHFSTCLILCITLIQINSCKDIPSPSSDIWEVDFFDDFKKFDTNNWQDQRIWVNDETHCYVPDNEFNTREVSNGTLKLRVVNIGEKLPCDNFDKQGKQHPDTEYVAGRIASKNRKEFIKGKVDCTIKIKK
jgi:beta-glucanase (GH16 family)